MSQSITVAVGSPDDLRSSIWRLWSQGDEVYFGARQLMPTLKVSLHKSGKWRIAWHKDLKSVGTDRIVCKWQRPPPSRGFVPALAVFVDPFPQKSPFKNKAIVDPEIKWLALAPHGKILRLKILIATKAADLDSGRLPPNERIVGRVKKANGEEALILAEEMMLLPETAQSIIQTRSTIKINVRKDGFERGEFFDTTRAVSISRPKLAQDSPAIFDLSLGWDNVFRDPA